MTRKQLLALLLLLILALAGFVIYYFVNKFDSAPVVLEPNTGEQVNSILPAPAVNPSTTDNQDQPVSSPTESLTYTNAEYGFSLTLPAAWQGFKAVARKIDWGAAGTSDSLDFNLPTQTDGVFNISILTKAQWAQIQKEDGPLPQLLAENATTVFAWSQAQYAADENIQERLREVQEIVKTFKLK
jgi:hypothetical protein